MLDIRVQRNKDETRPEHHIVAAEAGIGWTSYLPSWDPAPGTARTTPLRDLRRSFWGGSSGGGGAAGDSETPEPMGFRNPWPSWRKPTNTEVWNSLQWGEDKDPCIQLAASQIPQASPGPPKADSTVEPNLSQVDEFPRVTTKEASQLLRSETPDFSFDPESQRAKATWLGHAGILLQLPPLAPGGDPVRFLFDPIFSMRCSPTQVAGPARAFPPPCKMEDLPPVHVLVISHNHYDHLDYDSIMGVWKLNKEHMRLVVPLGNRQWFIDCGIAEDRVVELDWWESVHLSAPGAGLESKPLTVTCTPAQHSSGRAAFDANDTLWSSWFLEHPKPEPYRIFFAGDTGYQLHGSPSWPPAPPSGAESRKRERIWRRSKEKKEPTEDTEYPTCPVFEEIVSRLGRPQLLFLPVAVGATYSYLRSFTSNYLPDSVDPFPRHAPGITAATHMPPWDAVRALRLMSDAPDVGGDEAEAEASVAVAMHWGTFVVDAAEVLKTLGQLEWACDQHGVRFVRAVGKGDTKGMRDPFFVALNHGQSVSL